MNAVERRGEEEEPVVEKKSTCRSQTGNWGLASSARALLLQQGATPPLETERMIGEGDGGGAWLGSGVEEIENKIYKAKVMGHGMAWHGMACNDSGTVRQSRKERSMERVMSALKSEKLAIPLGVSIMV
ncbi:hypothetical protein V6N11_082534 [Hibiscus sabdariffa]|uniref:Uncharacterized protein n=1 Tax=Hibiscus sabdariffa TaxID=183260 RepID=A0ABR2N8W5_9ROSI